MKADSGATSARERRMRRNNFYTREVANWFTRKLRAEQERDAQGSLQPPSSWKDLPLSSKDLPLSSIKGLPLHSDSTSSESEEARRRQWYVTGDPHNPNNALLDPYLI